MAALFGFRPATPPSSSSSVDTASVKSGSPVSRGSPADSVISECEATERAVQEIAKGILPKASSPADFKKGFFAEKNLTQLYASGNPANDFVGFAKLLVNKYLKGKVDETVIDAFLTTVSLNPSLLKEKLNDVLQKLPKDSYNALKEHVLRFTSFQAFGETGSGRYDLVVDGVKHASCDELYAALMKKFAGDETAVLTHIMLMSEEAGIGAQNHAMAYAMGTDGEVIISNNVPGERWTVQYTTEKASALMHAVLRVNCIGESGLEHVTDFRVKGLMDFTGGTAGMKIEEYTPPSDSAAAGGGDSASTSSVRE